MNKNLVPLEILSHFC